MFKRICTILLFLPTLALGSVLPLEGGPLAPGAPIRHETSYGSYANELQNSDDYFALPWAGSTFSDLYTDMPDPFGWYGATQFNYTGAESFRQRYQEVEAPDSPAYDNVTISVKVKWVSGNPRVDFRLYDPEYVPTVLSNRVDFSATGVPTFVDSAQPYAGNSGPDANGWYTLTVSASGFAGHSTVRFAVMPFGGGGRSADQAVLIAGAMLQFNDTATAYKRTPVEILPESPANYVTDSGDFSQDGWSGTGSAIGREYYYGPTKELLSQTFTFATGDNNRNFWQNVDTYSSAVNVSFMTKHISGTPSPAFVLYDNDASAIVGGVAIDYSADGTYTYTSYGGSTPVIEELDGGYLRTSVHMPYYKGNDTNLEVYPFSVGASGDEVAITGMQITDGYDVQPYHQDQEYEWWLPASAMKYGNSFPFTSTEHLYWEVAQYDMFLYQAVSVYHDNEDLFDIDQYRAFNPNAKLGLYSHITAMPLVDWFITQPEGTYAHEYYTTLWPDYRAYGTDGENWYSWPDRAVINPLLPGFQAAFNGIFLNQFNPSVQEDNVGPRYVMFDYLSSPQDSYNVVNTGELDLDLDGIGHDSDADEQDAMEQAWVDMLTDLTNRMPTDAKVLVNGNLFLYNDDLRASMDGVMVEGAGAYWRPYGGKIDWAAMLDLDSPYAFLNIKEDFNPGGYTILEAQPQSGEAINNEQASMINLACAMMLWEEDHPVYGVVQGSKYGGAGETTHCLPEWGTFHYWGQVGAPTGRYYELADNIYRRDFENGYAVLTITNGGTYAYPFRWELFDLSGNYIYEYSPLSDITAPSYTYGDVAVDASGAVVHLFYSANYDEAAAYEVQWRHNGGAWSATINIPGYSTSTGSRTIDTGELPVEGDTFEVQVRATDLSANPSGWTNIELVTVPDVTAPVLSGESLSYTVEKVQTNLTLICGLTANELSIVQYYWQHNSKPAVPVAWTLDYSTDLSLTFATDLDLTTGDTVRVTAIAENQAGLQSSEYEVGEIVFTSDTEAPTLVSGTVSPRNSGGLIVIDWTAEASEDCDYALQWQQSNKGVEINAKRLSKELALASSFNGTITTSLPWVHNTWVTVDIELTDGSGNSSGWLQLGVAVVDDPPDSGTPSILAVTGTSSTTWTIDSNDSSFGSKSPAAPQLWENWEAFAAGPSNPISGQSPTWGVFSDNAAYGDPVPYVTTDRPRYPGDQSARLYDEAGGSAGGWDTVYTPDGGMDFSTGKVFLNWWIYVENNYPDDIYNMKLLEFSSGAEGGETAPAGAFVGAYNFGGLEFGHYTLAAQGSCSATPPGPWCGVFDCSDNVFAPQSGTNGLTVYAGSTNFNQWAQRELIAELNTPCADPSNNAENGYFHVRSMIPSGAAFREFEQDRWMYLQDTAGIDVPSMIRIRGYIKAYDTNASQAIQYGDIYVDNTWARVFIGDDPVYENCRHIEMQIPTAWSSDQITATANPGQFSGETAYLFVVNADGDVSAGYPVTID